MWSFVVVILQKSISGHWFHSNNLFGLEMPPRSPSAKRVQAFDGRKSCIFQQPSLRFCHAVCAALAECILLEKSKRIEEFSLCVADQSVK